MNQKKQPDGQTFDLIKQSKLTTDLFNLVAGPTSITSKIDVAEREAMAPGLLSSSSRVNVDIIAIDGDARSVTKMLADSGIDNFGTFGAVTSAGLSADEIADIASLPEVAWIQPTGSASNQGDATSQGDFAISSFETREFFGLDGQGIDIGILSDSFASFGDDAVEQDQRTGDLPPEVLVLEDTNGSDEGRAMAQILHDLAPGADLLFHTAFLGQASFAQGILELAEAGAEVIVDDVLYFREPLFQDGLISQAIERVSDEGVFYATSAGNAGIAGYLSEFRPVERDNLIADLEIDVWHDFNPGNGVDLTQRVTIPSGAELTLSLQWDEAFFSVSPRSGGSASDVDIFLLDDDREIVTSSTDSNIGRDPVEVLFYDNDSNFDQTFDIAIGLFDGPAPSIVQYVDFEGELNIEEFDTGSRTVSGHAPAPGAVSTAAAFYEDTPAFGSFTIGLEPFTSLGGPIEILFDDDGQRLLQPEIRQGVDITGPDGVDTTFFGFSDPDDTGFPNFFGTSAAAPHVAGAAALILEADPGLSNREIEDLLINTAIDINDPVSIGSAPGFDARSGAGLVDVFSAVDSLDLSRPERDPIGEFGTISGVTSSSLTVSLANDYNDPVIIAQPVSFNGSDPVTINIFDVMDNSFTIRLQEPSDEDGTHTAREEISYMVLEAGTWDLPGGVRAEAGTFAADNVVLEGFREIEFQNEFEDKPVLLAQSQTRNGGDWFTSRIDNVSSEGFDFAIQEEEALEQTGHTTENIGYIALDRAISLTGMDSIFQSGSLRSVSDEGRTLNLGSEFTQSSTIVAGISTFNGSDPAVLRKEGSSFFIVEETSFDQETAHGNESVDFIAFSDQRGLIFEEESGFFV